MRAPQEPPLDRGRQEAPKRGGLDLVAGRVSVEVAEEVRKLARLQGAVELGAGRRDRAPVELILRVIQALLGAGACAFLARAGWLLFSKKLLSMIASLTIGSCSRPISAFIGMARLRSLRM